MPLVDNPSVRNTIQNLFPGVSINGVPKPSGQRLVYFVTFNRTESHDYSNWGECVLKVMLAPNADSIARFQREIRILNELKSEFYPRHYHNNVFGEDPETEAALSPPWFVSIEERLEGDPLRSALTSSKIPEERVSEIGVKLINALDVLWEGTKQYVHRDLSPENILLDQLGNVRIIDLGLVRETGELGYTNDASDFGPCNPKYCSPEQTLNDKSNITYKSDMFIIGILLYEMASGEHPFWTPDIESRDSMFYAIREKTQKELENFGVSPALGAVVKKLLAKKPFERYRRPVDLKNDLIQIVGTQNG